MLSLTLSQWRDRSVGVMWENLGIYVANTASKLLRLSCLVVVQITISVNVESKKCYVQQFDKEFHPLDGVGVFAYKPPAGRNSLSSPIMCYDETNGVVWVVCDKQLVCLRLPSGPTPA